MASHTPDAHEISELLGPDPADKPTGTTDLSPTPSPPPSPPSSRAQKFLADVRAHRNAYALTAIASFGGMLFGWDTGIISGIIAMDAFQHSFNLDPTSSSYAGTQGNIVTMLPIGAFCGAVSSFYLSDVWGRKRAIYLAAVLFVVGTLLQMLAGIHTTGLAQIYVGRLIGGMGVGIISPVVPSYIAENAHKDIRGRCGGCFILFQVTGIMLAYFVNYGLNKDFDSSNSLKWRIPFLVSLLPAIPLLFGLPFLNESPRWLVEKERHGEALRALAHIRTLPEDDPSVQQEFRDIVDDFAGKERLSLARQFRLCFASRSSVYILTMSMSLHFWHQWSGIVAVAYYGPELFKDIGLKGTSAGLFATGIYGVVKVVTTCMTLGFATEQVGRKWSLIVSGLGQAFAMLYIGVNGALNPVSAGAPLTGHSIFAVMCIYIFVVFFSFGWGCIPYVMSPECAPNHLRAAIMSMTMMVQWSMSYVIAKTVPYMLRDLRWGTYLVFGCCGVAMAAWAVFCVPETKGVPLEHVHRLFEKDIIKGCINDTIPARTRARKWQDTRRGSEEGEAAKGSRSHLEQADSLENWELSGLLDPRLN